MFIYIEKIKQFQFQNHIYTVPLHLYHIAEKQHPFCAQTQWDAYARLTVVLPYTGWGAAL